MPMQLVTMTGLERGRVLPLRDGDIVQLGCSQNLDILSRFRDPQVARVHCEIQVQGKRVVLQDARTPNGTFVNGLRITETELQPGDVIKIGHTEMRFQCEEGEVTTTKPVSQAAPPNPAQDTTEQKVQVTCYESAPRSTPTVGDEILGKLVGREFVHFRVEVVLGRGYWGRVFKAVDKRTGQTVALKVMRPEFGEHEGRLQRFGQALRAVLPLDHPNLLRHYGAGKAGGFCWATSEFVDGKSLTQVIRRNLSTGRHNVSQAARVALEVCAGLQALHERDLLYLSLTPQNVLVGDRDKRARLSDLLIALSLQGNLIPYSPQVHNRLEETGCLAPEQLAGCARFDARTDLYAVGVLLYQLLTGQMPFSGASCEDIVERIGHDDPEPPRSLNRDIPAKLDGLVLCLLAKNADDRLASACATIKALEPFAASPDVR
jgi:eukaryotic-like serine/threonine-protein kinase